MSYSCTCRSARKASSPASRSACVGKLATIFNRSLSRWYFRKLPVNGTGDPSSTWSIYVGNPIPIVGLQPTNFAATFFVDCLLIRALQIAQQIGRRLHLYLPKVGKFVSQTTERRNFDVRCRSCNRPLCRPLMRCV